MHGAVEVVTPEIAAAFLSSMPDCQRKKRPARVLMYSSDRQNGLWRLTHQGIGIDVNGKMIDGQHRCEMVIATGMPTAFFVIRNVPPDSVIEIDNQLPRSFRDGCMMAGVGDFTDAKIACARMFTIAPFSSWRHPNLTRHELIEIIEECDEALEFAVRNMRGQGVTKAARTVVARAYYHADIERLSRWCEIIKTGMATEKTDSSAITYRNVLARHAGIGGPALELERYCKGQSALHSFLRKESLVKVYAVAEDLFPIPGRLAACKRFSEDAKG